MTHTLKTLPAYWDAVERGDKTFEVRRDDRGFKVGDIVFLLRWEDGRASFAQHPLGFTLNRRIRYILTGGQFGIEPGYVVMQLEELDA